MKKILTVFSLVLALVVGASLFAACGKKKHNYDSKWSTDKNYHWHSCTDKGCKSVKDKAKHTFDKWVTTKEPTATTKGQKTRSCTVCKEKQVQEIPATGKKKSLSLASKLYEEFNYVTNESAVEVQKDCEGDCGNCDFVENDQNYFADGNCGMTFIEDDENFFGDNFGKACEEAEQKNDKIQALKKQFDEIMDARADLWDKVFASYDQLDDDFDYANFDEAKYIAELSVLSAEEKQLLLDDLAKLDEISSQLYETCGANCGRW